MSKSQQLLTKNMSTTTLTQGRIAEAIMNTIVEAVANGEGTSVPRNSLMVVFIAYGLPERIFNEMVRALILQGELKSEGNLLSLP